MTNVLPHEDWDVSGFQRDLLIWFQHEGRSFPWRETTDPFAILIAEKLLQQTQARDSVVAAFQTLLGAYPSAEALATANPTDLRDIIQPLGLGYRAIELKTMAGEIAGRYAGVVPDDLRRLVALTGVGAYGARAVLSFAFGHDIAVVDTNVARIYFRVFDIHDRMPANPARKRSLINLGTALLPAGQARPFNFALIDLGALICTPRTPDCPHCPVFSYCAFGQRQSQRLT